MSRNIRLATRGSELALVQTREVARRLQLAHPAAEVRELVIRTAGDKNLDTELAKVGAGDKGLFTKELEEALLDGRADAAVHSLKDLPTELPAGLCLGAILPRADSGDVLVSPAPGGISALADGTRIGTGSPRRQAMLHAARPGLQAALIRGNVPTRLAKLAAGEYGAVIVAAAGLARLGWTTDGSFMMNGKILHTTPLKSFLPAPGQGAVAVEIRATDAETKSFVSAIHDDATAIAVTAERAVLAGLGGGCHMALGTLARVEDGALQLEAVLFPTPAASPRHVSMSGSADSPEALGHAVAAKLNGG